MAALNGTCAWVVAALAWAGSKAVWEPQGLGPNRLALADLVGPFRDYTAWFLASIGLLLVVVGVGLFLLKPWARRVTIAAVGGSALSTLVVMVWALRLAHWDVVAAGLGKCSLEIALCYYMVRHARDAFAGRPTAA